MKSIAINGSLRKNVGKKDATHLRREDNVPCLLFGGKEPVHFTAPSMEFKKLVYTPNVYTVDLTIEGKQYKAVMCDLQFHPVTEKLLHIDFMEIFPDKFVVMDVPIKLSGTAIGVREGGELVTKMRMLKVKALPANLPDSVELNVEPLLLSKAIRVEDVKIKDVEILDPPNNIITVVKTARVYVEETPVAAVTTEVAAPVAGAEGAAAPAEGGAAPAKGAAPAAAKGAAAEKEKAPAKK